MPNDRAYVRTIMNDEGNEDDCNGFVSSGIVHMEDLGSSMNLRQGG